MHTPPRSAPPFAWRRRLLGGLLALAAAVPAIAQPAATPSAADATASPASVAPTAGAPGDAMQAVRLLPGERLTLNGRLDHPAWQRAPAFVHFVEKDPVGGAVPPQATRVQVLFDEQAVYVGVTALETRPHEMRDVPVRRDGVNRTQDFVVVYVDAIGGRQSAQFFRLNSAGSMADGLHTAADDNEDFSPDYDWDGATARTPEGWTAVFRLPFASLRFAEGDQRWHLMVARRLPRQQYHLVASTPIPRDAPSFIHTMNPLRGMALPQRHSFLTVRPSFTARSLHEQGVARQRDTEASLDVKWRPLAELVVDGTLNPDFSQVELDVPQLAGNTQFALSLAEKRPFFFESADLLQSPTDAFYTRSFTAPRAGLRGSWRGNTVAGTAFAVDDRGGGVVLLPGPFGTGAVDQPASRSVGFRALHDHGALKTGVLASSRRYAAGQGSNEVLGADAGWQIDERWRARAQLLGSRTTAFTADRGTESGHLLQAQLWRQTASDEQSFTLEDSSERFRQDMGFYAQTGVRAWSARTQHTWHGVGPFHTFQFNLRGEQRGLRANGQTVSMDLVPGLYAAGAHNLEWWLNWHGGAAQRVGPRQPLLRENYVNVGAVFSPAPWMPLMDTELTAGDLADTQAGRVRPGWRWNLGTRLRLLRPLELEPSVATAQLREDGLLQYRETATRVLAVWHLDARQNLRGIWQRTVLDRRAGPGTDAFEFALETLSATYSWRPSTGTRLFLGASQTRGGARPVHTEAFLKLQFDMDEMVAWLRPAAAPGS